MNKIQKKLYELQDKKFADFQSSLIPTIDKKDIIGVRTADIKKLAKDILIDDSYKGEKDKFLKSLPHKYFDEMQLHIFLLNQEKDTDLCLKQINIFLPYIDNWATCDQLSPSCLKKDKKLLLKYIDKWIKSKKAYEVRFAIKMLMSHFLDEDFDKKYLDVVAKINYPYTGDEISVTLCPDKYYVEMMIAWYFATALAKQYKETLPYIKNKKLNEWTHNKTIQKAVESYRLTDEQKNSLRKFKM